MKGTQGTYHPMVLNNVIDNGRQMMGSNSKRNYCKHARSSLYANTQLRAHRRAEKKIKI
jgi:ATP-dependent protease HslVU (ClpYQ) peptidase subunit